jgi:glutamine synthetase
MDGIRKRIEPPSPIDVNIYHLSDTERRRLHVKTLPTSLEQALEEWKSDEICIKVLGREIAEKYLDFKTQEWKEYRQHTQDKKNEVTPWEMQKYLF